MAENRSRMVSLRRSKETKQSARPDEAVKPDKYTLRPTDLGSSEDDFVFRFNGHDVGRTYADGTPVGLRWYWSIYGINLRGPLPDGVVVQGLADDLAAAGATFKANWKKLLAAGSVKPEK